MATWRRSRPLELGPSIYHLHPFDTPVAVGASASALSEYVHEPAGYWGAVCIYYTPDFTHDLYVEVLGIAADGTDVLIRELTLVTAGAAAAAEISFGAGIATPLEGLRFAGLRFRILDTSAAGGSLSEFEVVFVA